MTATIDIEDRLEKGDLTMTHKTRLDQHDSVMDAMMKLGEGNPGALRVLYEIMRDTKAIDPDDLLGGIGPLLTLDTCAIYGSKIWMLYKDVCRENLVHTIAVLRAFHLGFLSLSALHHAIENNGEGILTEEILSHVKERLPRFAQH